ncbi:hypothetical protein NEA10_06215 [Phormidium yuhuli AB48]|uniref:Sulfatase-modifying factor enzyme-like domain-containing protein n=1 Tax=Phormidium yuhuli AB48 TaxID=2940671 RepID=A0ABY5AV15_9CYAN|nr:SUMF1/EgtB/PvdO family nonheme iron enzyme [Phormidium yuhuli]USR93118.1 hypothetical protein NEA10_06215 [Phormidium yuhuli AB48]
MRGGSWNNNPRNCRSANRNRNTPDNRNNNIGFRVCCSVALTLHLPELGDGNPSGVPSRVQTCSSDTGDSIQKSSGSG